MKVSIHFHPHLKELTGCERTSASLASGTSVGALHGFLIKRFPKLAALHTTTHTTVNGAPRPHDFALQEGSVVALAPME